MRFSFLSLIFFLSIAGNARAGENFYCLSINSGWGGVIDHYDIAESFNGNLRYRHLLFNSVNEPFSLDSPYVVEQSQNIISFKVPPTFSNEMFLVQIDLDSTAEAPNNSWWKPSDSQFSRVYKGLIQIGFQTPIAAICELEQY